MRQNIPIDEIFKRSEGLDSPIVVEFGRAVKKAMVEVSNYAEIVGSDWRTADELRDEGFELDGNWIAGRITCIALENGRKVRIMEGKSEEDASPNQVVISIYHDGFSSPPSQNVFLYSVDAPEGKNPNHSSVEIYGVNENPRFYQMDIDPMVTRTATDIFLHYKAVFKALTEFQRGKRVEGRRLSE